MQHIKIIDGFEHILFQPLNLTASETAARSETFLAEMQSRRSIRHFSERTVPRSVIQNLIRTAGTAPSGAHKQPWTFCAISNAALKTQIRQAAEQEEYESYTHRMSDTWLADLAPLGTDWQKPFLETAPWLIVVFGQTTGPHKEKHYYVQESVGIAAGMLITAIHQAGLATLTHTPSPMNFLKKILNRPDHERPFLLLPVGYPADEVYVPHIQRKSLEEIAVFYD